MSPGHALSVGVGDSYDTNGASMKALATELERLIGKLPLPDAAATRPARTRAKHSVRELRADELAAMIAIYQAGATLSELAAKYDYNRVGISSALKHAGVLLRHRGLNQQTEASTSSRSTKPSTSTRAECRWPASEPDSTSTPPPSEPDSSNEE